MKFSLTCLEHRSSSHLFQNQRQEIGGNRLINGGDGGRGGQWRKAHGHRTLSRPTPSRIVWQLLTFVKDSDYQAPYTFNLCSSVGLCGITLLALRLETELSLKLLHESCGLRLMPNMRQQCSKSHSQHQHSEQQQNIRRGTHNRHGIAAKLLLFSGDSKLVLKTEQIALCRNSVTTESHTRTGFLSA